MFEPRPSLQLAVDYIVTQCVRKYPLEKCSACDTTALPCDPQVMSHDTGTLFTVCVCVCLRAYMRACVCVCVSIQVHCVSI